MKIQLLDLMQNDKEVAEAVDTLIMARLEIKADDLEKMSDEQYEILEPFIDKYYNDNAVKEILEKHIKQGKTEGKDKIKEAGKPLIPDLRPTMEEASEALSKTLQEYEEKKRKGDWVDIPADEMTEEQLKEAVTELRKYIAEIL